MACSHAAQISYQSQTMWNTQVKSARFRQEGTEVFQTLGREGLAPSIYSARPHQAPLLYERCPPALHKALLTSHMNAA